MQPIQSWTLRARLLAIGVLLICWSSAFTMSARAQQGSQGQDAVYNSTSGIVGSSSFIDASMYLPPHSNGTQGLDICDAINGILGNRFGGTYPVAGAVIDARGISGTTNLSCTHGSPWKEGTTTVSAPSTILLPAGTIVVNTPWVLPNNTHLIGEGDSLNLQATSVAAGTVIQANFASGDMIDLCSATCNSVSV